MSDEAEAIAGCGCLALCVVCFAILFGLVAGLSESVTQWVLR